MHNLANSVQVWNAPVPNPELLGLRKGLSLKKLLRHFRSVVMVVEVEVDVGTTLEASDSSDGSAINSRGDAKNRCQKAATTWRVCARTDLNHTLPPTT